MPRKSSPVREFEYAAVRVAEADRHLVVARLLLGERQDRLEKYVGAAGGEGLGNRRGPRGQRTRKP